MVRPEATPHRSAGRHAARERPLAQALTIQCGKRKGKREARISPEARAYWERLGVERAALYLFLVCTGLRKGEAEAVEVRHLTLDGEHPRVELPGAATKNKESCSVPLAPVLVTALKEWLAMTGKSGTDRLFTVVDELVRTLRKDLEWAGIPYKDAQGRCVDVHALRHTCCTWLARHGVHQRAAQAHMRHKTAHLTSQVYTDVSQLDQASVLKAFPESKERPG
jgi:integrase